MKVLFFYNGSYPRGMAMTRRLQLYAKALQESGSQVEVVVPGRRGCNNQQYEGVPYRVLASPVVGRSYWMRQALGAFWALMYARTCRRWSRQGKLIFLCGFGWWASFCMLTSLRFSGGKSILEVNENPYAPEGGRLDPLWLRIMRRWLVLHLVFPLANGFVVISEKLENLVRRYKRSAAQILRVPVLANCDETFEQGADCPPDTVLTNGNPYMLHAGALSETKDGVMAVFEAFTQVNTVVRFDFYLTSSAMAPKLARRVEDMLQQNDLKQRVHFTGLLSPQALALLRKGSALAVINKPMNRQNAYNFPTKLAEYLSDGIPLVVSSGGEMARYLEHGKQALVARPNDAADLATCMLRILKEPELAASLSLGGKALAKEGLHYQQHSPALFTFFRRVAHPKVLLL